MMSSNQRDILIYLRSVKTRINGLGNLRNLVGTRAIQHLSNRQWDVLDGQILNSRKKLLSTVKNIMYEARNKNYSPVERAKMYRQLGQIEMELAKAYGFFDTYLDILSQRTTSELGPILSGIDVIAESSIRIDLPKLKDIVRPLVYCDRGFGASILREGIPFPDGSFNPMPLIQIPYSRIKVKYLLTSVIHEAGHQTITRLGIKTKMARIFYNSLKSKQVPERIARLYSNWSTEIGPDFWAFCQTGYSQTAGLKEVLTLPAAKVFKLGKLDPHPSPYIRTLLSISWCQRAFGEGIWDRWEKEWKNTYPLSMRHEKKELFAQIITCFPVVNRILFEYKWDELGNRSFTEIFPLEKVDLHTLKKIGNQIKDKSIIEKTHHPPKVIGAYRYLIDFDPVDNEQLDQAMTDWIKSLHKKTIKNNASWQKQIQPATVKLAS